MFFQSKHKKTLTHFIILKNPVNATTSLLRPGFYGPTVVALTGFHCITKVAVWRGSIVAQAEFKKLCISLVIVYDSLFYNLI